MRGNGQLLLKSGKLLWQKANESLYSHSRNYVRYEVFAAVTMKNVIFWDIKPQFVLHSRYITSPLQSPAG
jgi:hypothetical protein